MKIVLLYKLEKKVYDAYSKDIKIYKNKEKEFEQTKANVLNNDENNNQNNNANNNIITNQNNPIINQNNNNPIIYPNNIQIIYPNNNHIEETKENELILNMNTKKEEEKKEEGKSMIDGMTKEERDNMSKMSKSEEIKKKNEIANAITQSRIMKYNLERLAYLYDETNKKIDKI